MEMSLQLNCKNVFPYRSGCVKLNQFPGVLPRRSVTFASGYMVITKFFLSYSCLCFMFSVLSFLFFLNWINMVVNIRVCVLCLLDFSVPRAKQVGVLLSSVPVQVFLVILFSFCCFVVLRLRIY